jgi:glycerophosphoryl diester phosphodiesterase
VSTAGASKPYLDLRRPWLFAHRGGAALAPENTLAAFDAAVRLGADAIETDVRLVRDGIVVVYHDESTDRLCGVPGTIEDRTLAEVRGLDAGARFTLDGGHSFPWRGRGAGIPTLAEALRRYPATRFNIEAKTAEPALAEALAWTVRSEDAVARVCLGSFDDEQAERLRALVPEACHFLPQGAATCHVLAAKQGADASGCPGGYEVADLPVRTEDGFEVVDAAVVNHFHALGVAVFVWTVDDEADMRRLLALGVDGIMTDRPDLLRRVLGR